MWWQSGQRVEEEDLGESFMKFVTQYKPTVEREEVKAGGWWGGGHNSSI